VPLVHQSEALDFAYGLRRYAWFMGMGTGKTKSAIDLNICHFMEGTISRWIIYVPVNIRENWVREIAKHSPITDIPIYVLESGKKAEKQVAEIIKQERSITIIGIESLQQDRKGTVYEAAMSLVVGAPFSVTVDESHNCKGFDANRAKNIGHLSLNATIMGIMTGTPQSQGFEDLFMQYEIMDPNILGFGSYYSFRSKFCVMGGFEDKQIVNYEHIEELMDLIKPFTYQKTKDQALPDLPPKLRQVMTVPMIPDQKKAYKDMDDAMHVTLPTTKADLEVYVEQMITKYGALQQISGGFLMVEDEPRKIELPNGEFKLKRVRHAERLMPVSKNPKIKALVNIAKENPKNSIIIWCKYREEIAMVVEGLDEEFGIGCAAQIHGGIDRDDRMSIVDDFNEKRNRFMVSNAPTGGVGLNMVVSDLVVYYSNSFSLTDREQSEDRAHRIGQVSDKVMYIELFAEGTHDSEVYDALMDKKNLADYLKEGLTVK
jgi:SNF2 family DNA or RNA helicase